MHLRKLITSLVRILKPDKSLYRDLSEDLRKLGVMWVGGSLATYLLQSPGIALLVFVSGVMIWLIGIGIANKAIAMSRDKENG